VSSVSARGHQLQRTQGTGVPALRVKILSSGVLPLSPGPWSSGQGFEARDHQCDLPTSDSEQEPVTFELCVRL